MKFLVAVILTGLLAFVSGLFLPWWGISFAAFLVALLIRQGGARSWFSGFLGIFLLWGGLALWINLQNQGILAERIAKVFSLGNPVILILVTGIIGGLVAGFAALSGNYLRASR